MIIDLTKPKKSWRTQQPVDTPTARRLVWAERRLIEYGQHLPGCPARYDRSRACLCGWRKALMELQHKE